MKHPALLALSFSIAVSTAAAHPTWDYGSMAKAAPGDGANLHGAVPFPADNAWNTDISKAPVDPDSDNSIASIGAATGLHPDFGSGTHDGAIIGIPCVVVAGTQAFVPIKLGVESSRHHAPK